MSAETNIVNLSATVGKLHKKYKNFFENHYHINGVFSDLLSEHEKTIKDCGFSIDSFDNTLMSLGRLYFDLNQEVLKKKEQENVGFEVLKAFEIGRSAPAKRLVYYLLIEVLHFNKLDATMFKWNNCIFCGASVYPYHNKCEVCNTEFTMFYETDELFNKIIVEIASEIDSTDMAVLRNLQKRIIQFQNNQNVRRLEATSTADKQYLSKIKAVSLEYENIEDKFISIELEGYEAKAVELEKFTLHDASKKAIDGQTKKLIAIDKYIASLFIKETSTVFERVSLLKLSVNTCLEMIKEKAKLVKTLKSMKDLEKRVKGQLNQASGKSGFKLTQEKVIFELSSEFGILVKEINTGYLEKVSNAQFQSAIMGISSIFDNLDSLKKIKKDNDFYLDVMKHRLPLASLIKEVETKAKKVNYGIASALIIVEAAKKEWIQLDERAYLVKNEVSSKDGVDNLKTLDEILDQESQINIYTSKIHEQMLLCDELIEKIKYQNRKREIDSTIKEVQKKYTKIQKNKFFIQEYNEKHSRKRLKTRLKGFTKLLDDLSLMKKDMKVLSDGIRLNSFDEQRDTSKELSDTFDMEYNRIYEENEEVVELHVEKTKKFRKRLYITLGITVVLIIGGFITLQMMDISIPSLL